MLAGRNGNSFASYFRNHPKGLRFWENVRRARDEPRIGHKNLGIMCLAFMQMLRGHAPTFGLCHMNLHGKGLRLSGGPTTAAVSVAADDTTD